MKCTQCLVWMLAAVCSPVVADDARVGPFTLGEARDEASGELRRSIAVDPLRASVSPTQGVALVWICANGVLRVFYAFGTPIQGDETGAAVVRFRGEDGEFIEQEWWVSGGGLRLVMPAGDEPPLSEIAAGEGTLVTEVIDPADGRQLSHRFPLARFNAAIEHLPCKDG